MVSRRSLRRVERWTVLSRAGAGLGALGIAGKSVTSAGVFVFLIGLLASPVAAFVGVSIALLGFAAWWGSARVVSSRVELSTGRVMWMMWCIPTWSALGDFFASFDAF